MAERDLTVVLSRRPPGWRHARPVLLAALVLVAGLAGFSLRAPRGPAEREPFATARETLDRILRDGPASDLVRASMIDFRARLGRAPLDSRVRGAYAALVLFGGSGPDSMDAAAFHARVAAEYAPVTVPVVRRAAFVLVESRRYDEALDLVRDMYAYDPEAASDVLATVRPFLDRERLRDGLPEEPDAWVAWSRRLDSEGEREEAAATLEAARARFPEDLGVLTALARHRLLARDVAGLAGLLVERELPSDRRSALLRVFRAQALAWTDDPDGARSELDAAFNDASEDLDVLRHGGDVWDDLDESDVARRWWNRGRFLVPASNPRGRVPFAARIARMEERRGRPVDALRAWRAVLELDPGNEFAQRRIRELGASPP